MCKSLTEIHASPLLHHLECHSEDYTAEIARWLPSTTKATGPARLHMPLVSMISDELIELIPDIFRVGSLPT